MESDKNLHKGHRQRMKKRFAEFGSDSFSDHQLLELLLFYAIPQKDTNPIAHRLINQFHNLSGVLDAPLEELEKIEGISEHTALLIHLLPHLMRRYQSNIAENSNRVMTIRDVAEYLRPYFFAAQTELVYMVSLDGKGRFLGCDQLDEGGVNLSHIDTRNMAMHALSHKAASVVLAHCHPMGSPDPSPADCMTTEHCKKVLATLKINLIDHLVFADDQWVSMAKLDLI